jgi:hypothetical protein
LKKAWKGADRQHLLGMSNMIVTIAGVFDVEYRRMPVRRSIMNSAEQTEKLFVQTIDDMFEIIVSALDAAVLVLSRVANAHRRLPIESDNRRNLRRPCLSAAYAKLDARAVSINAAKSTHPTSGAAAEGGQPAASRFHTRFHN